MSRGLNLKKVALALIGLLGALWLINPASARAGAYRAFVCHPGEEAPFAPDLQASGSFGDNGTNVMSWSRDGCAEGNDNFGIHLKAVGLASYGAVYTALAVRAPAGAYIDGGNFHYSGWGDAYDSWSHGAYLMNDAGGVVQSWGGGYGNQPVNKWYSIDASGGSGRTLLIDQGCWRDPGGVCSGEDDISIKYIWLKLVDTSPPQIEGLSGSLLDGVAHGVAGLRLRASDAGGGIRYVSVEVNERPVAAPSASCPGFSEEIGFAVQARPCEDLDAAMALDTERQPWHNGSNALRVCVSDLSTEPEPANYTCAERTVQVDNSCPDSQGAGAEASAISAGLADRKTRALHRSRSVRSTEGVPLRGSLSGPGGPVRGASVCVYETIDEPVGISQLVQVAKSTSTGEFAVQLPPGPSRTIEVAYRYGDHQIKAPSMHLDSSVVPSLKLTRKKLRNGRSIGFRGSLPGPQADGVAVALQARVGHKWRTFKQVTSDATGAFRGKYRFTQTHGVVRYLFRALVKKQGGYPYSQGASPERKLVVYG